MEIVLKRIAKKVGYTIGHLYLLDNSQVEASWDLMGKAHHHVAGDLLNDGSYFCDTLEPTWRNLLGEPLPPELEGTAPGRVSCRKAYKIKGLTAIPEGTYPLVITKSMKFRRWLPLVVGVPDFSGIRIHAGNTAKDTQGCILVGKNTEVGRVNCSASYLDRLIERIVAARKHDEAVWLLVE